MEPIEDVLAGSAQVYPATEDMEARAAIDRLNEARIVYRAAKRAFDVVFGLAAVVLFCWLYLIVAVAIKLDDPKGPIIYRQTRCAKDGRLFTMYKFRSMVVGADEGIALLKDQNEKTGPAFKMKNDPRVTRVGRVIRKMSLDELPQFVNVIKGDMSVVGPRPPLPSEVAEYTPRQRQRLGVNQGITSYWQTQKRRDEIDFDQWVELDLKYIKECGIMTDFKLVLKTVGVVLTSQGC